MPFQPLNYVFDHDRGRVTGMVSLSATGRLMVYPMQAHGENPGFEVEFKKWVTFEDLLFRDVGEMVAWLHKHGWSVAYPSSAGSVATSAA